MVPGLAAVRLQMAGRSFKRQLFKAGVHIPGGDSLDKQGRQEGNEREGPCYPCSCSQVPPARTRTCPRPILGRHLPRDAHGSARRESKHAKYARGMNSGNRGERRMEEERRG
eukprot:755538-Hanusia_phi.AAC.2